MDRRLRVADERAPGESITFYVSTNPPSSFRMQIYRLGYYQGHGGRLVMELGPFNGSVQPDPPVGPNRLRECAWAPCAEITIPRDWTSGVYLGKLTAELEGMQSYIVFVVRDDRKCDFLFQVSDTTWNAYNRWPNQFSLYDDGKKEWYWGPNVATSFDRPYGKYCQVVDAPLSVGSGEFLLWEFPLAYWMEQHGVRRELHLEPRHSCRPGQLASGQGLAVGRPRRILVVIDVRDDETYGLGGIESRVLVGQQHLWRDRHPPIERWPPWPDHRTRWAVRLAAKEEIEKGFPEEALFTKNGPNEATLMGAQSTYPVTGGGDWICRKPGHWLFAGTGMKLGDGIPGLVGWEWHGEPAPIPGLEVVASGKTKAPVPKERIRRRFTQARRETSYSMPPRSGGPTGFPHLPVTFARRFTPGPRAPIRACSGSRGTCSNGCGAPEPYCRTAKTIHPPARRLCANQGRSIDADDTSSSGKTSWILKPAPRSSRFSSPQR